MAEELALEEVLRDGGAVDGDERLLVALAVGVDGPGNEFLAAPTLTGDQHRGVAHGNTANHFEDRLHRLGTANDVITVLFDRQRRFGRGGCAEFGCGLERRIDDHLHGEGSGFLSKKIKGTEFHRLDDGLRRPESTHHDDHGVDGLSADLGQQFESGGGTQVELRQDEVGLLQAEDLEGVRRVRLGDHAHAGGLELLLHPVEEVGFGIDNQDGLVALSFEFHLVGAVTGFSTAPPKRRSRVPKSAMASRSSAGPKSGQRTCVTWSSV